VGETAAADFTEYQIFATKISVTAKQGVPGGEFRVLQIKTEDLANTPEGAALPSGVVRCYFGIIDTNIDDNRIQSAKIEFTVPRVWAEQNDVDENTIKLLRWFGDNWQELPTIFLKADAENLYFEATTPGFSLFAAVGMTKTPSVVLGLPPMLIFALLSVFGVIGGGVGYFVYIRKIRPIPQVIPLKRLIQMSRPAPKLPRHVAPAVRLEMLKPAPVTQVPGVPTEPVEPVPISAPSVKPSVATPLETLTALQKVRLPAVAPGKLKGAIIDSTPVSLVQLANVARPVISAAEPLEELAKITKETSAIPIKRLEVTIKPMEPAITLELLKKKIDASSSENHANAGVPIQKLPRRKQKP
jgi:PGF-pre-PGF domain-containing protein